MTDVLDQVACSLYFFDIHLWFCVRWFLNLIIFDGLYEGLVPDAHVDVAVEVAA